MVSVAFGNFDMVVTSHFDRVLALLGTLVPKYYLADAAGDAVQMDSGTISLCMECSGMMALCLCHGS